MALDPTQSYVHLAASGLAEIVPGGEQLWSLPDDGRGAVVVPKGVWHTAKVLAPSRMLFVTMGAGTQHRPVGAKAA